MSLYLGLDSSTQSLTAMVVDRDASRRAVVFEHAIVFDRDLPEYGTRHGVLPSTDPRVAEAPPALWADALDRMMGVVAANVDVSRIAAVSGSAQQHGSVYLTPEAPARFTALDPERPIVRSLAGAFARPVSPIWMDASTTEDCRAITAAMGGAGRLARLTGSRAFERFTGPQIRKFHREQPENWRRTGRIHLVSSFLASLLIGGDAPLEPGDASGMNLLDLAAGRWHPDALAATAPDLASRLPRMVAPWTVVGVLSPYWRARHGFPAARVVAWSGDNPSSLVGTGLVREGQVAVSLGTSDTVFGPMRAPRVDPSGTGHVSGAPTGGFMALTCFRNGSLARERVRDAYGLDWAGFSEALGRTPAGNGGALMLPWFEPEITPDVPAPAVRRLGLDEADGPANVRAVVEAQMLAMARHSRWMGVEVDVILATGGAAANAEILQVMADVFGAEVRRFATTHSACLGAALRALHGDRLARGEPLDWPDVVRGLAEPLAGSAVRPIRAHRAVYEELGRRAADFERRCLTPASRS